MNEFLTCFNCCDVLIILKTYSAREKEIIGGRAFDLYENIKKTGNFNKRLFYFDNFETVKSFLNKTLSKQDNVLFLGAGNICDLAKSFSDTKK